MADVVWTPQARRDVAAIIDYYLGIAPAFAEVVQAGILDSTRRLAAFPLSGRQVPEIGDETIREVIWREYRVIYFSEPDGGHVEVLTVLHSSQQFGAPS